MHPYFDGRATTAAKKWGLPSQHNGAGRPGPGSNARLAAALVRMALDDDPRRQVTRGWTRIDGAAIMASSTTFVIVGGGLAGAKAVEALRDNDFDGQIILFAEEEYLPYERPPLSKEYRPARRAERFTVHDSDWYRDHDVDLRLGARVSSLSRRAHRRAPRRQHSALRQAAVATGSASRRPPIPGSDAAGVHYLRTYDDAAALNSVLAEGSSLAVRGRRLDRPGGGRQCASARRQRHRRRGGQTTTDGRTRRKVGEVFATLHRDHGVDLRLEAQVEEITVADGRPPASGSRRVDGRR